ncbi:hypothetical protein QX776_12510 [Alteromonadaceae bacterium BrNp21-10]|nr:hypothetical protein [Alteromonadaceae bacterium BrNp21-10]
MMIKRIFNLIFIVNVLLFSHNALSLTPTFHMGQEINFGSIVLSTGSCSMIPTTGALTSHVGQFICEFQAGSQYGSYTITANPNKIIQVKMTPDLDNGSGYIFNPRASMFSDVASKVVHNNTDFVEINSGSSGIVNIYLGGELTVYSLPSAGQTINFSFDAAIEWNEID